MAPDTRAERETRHNATEPVTSAGSHDTVGRTTTSFGPPKDVTAASAWSDISRMSYISPANVGFEPSAPVAPYERPMAPTPGPGMSPSPENTPALFRSDYLLSDLLPSSRAPSSCDFGTPKDFGTSRNFAHTPVFGPSPPFVPKTRGRAAFQARCETASPSSETLSRFLRDFTSEVCDEDAYEQDALPMLPTTNSPITCEPTPVEQAHVDVVTTDSRIAHEPTTTEQAHIDAIPTNSPITHQPATIEQAHVDAFTTWSLYAVPGNILADFVSGILKFSQLDQDGNPVFVKDTDTNISPQQQSSNSHKDVNAVHVSQEETRIFVSMDQLRKQIAELQEHDEAMEREADKAHQEKARLELQLQEVRGTCRKASSDSAIGSDSDDDIRKRAQAEKLKRMQKRLDEANTLANSQHVHIDALTAERDELIKECHLAHAHKKVLSEQNQALHKENQAMKSQIQQAEQYFLSIENEATQLKSENDRLRQQISQMYQQNDSLRKTRKSHSDQIKNLQSELEATRGQLGDTIKDTQVLRTKNRENKAHSEQVEKLKAELEATRGQLSNARKDNELLRSENKEQLELLKTELEETRAQLGDTTNDIKVLVHKNKEIKAQRDQAEDMFESLQHEYTVIHRKLRDESTVSSTGSVVRARRPPSIQIKRTAVPTASAARVASPPATATTKAPPASASSVASDDEDHTTRPVYDPLENMRILISTTESEVARLQKKLDEKNAESKAMHKGYSRRAWERLHQEKVALESAIHEKSKIIYHQYDLLEGIRRKGRV